MAGRDSDVLVLGARELQALSAEGVVRTYRRNTVIVNEGDNTDSLYIILAGRVKVFVSDEAGKEIVLATQGPGEYFGEMVLDGGPRSASVVTLENSKFAVVSQPVFRKFLRSHPEFSLHLTENLIRRVRVLTENVKSLALMDVYGRVARLLLELAVTDDGRRVIKERLTHQEIANRVGASREMISKILKDLTVGGYISLEHRRIVVNRDPPRHW